MDENKLTPMYRQWAQAKREHPDVLLLFRMGDFYEMFGEDARVGSELLDLTLTSRKHTSDNDRIPMCGIPHHSVHKYLRRLVESGHKAAICEQVEDPREAKGLVKREVTRVVTPGTVMEDELLEGSDHNFLASVAVVDDRAGIAVVEASTGEFLVTELPLSRAVNSKWSSLEDGMREGDGRFGAVLDELARLQPAEILLQEHVRSELAECGELAQIAAQTTVVDSDEYEFMSAQEQLTEFFGVDSLRGFGCHGMAAAQAAAAQAVRYLKDSRKDALPHLSGISTYSTDEFMVIDAATRRNLELTRTLREGSREGTVLALLDRTLTPMGGRLLRRWVLQPLLDVDQINRRLDAVETLVGDNVAADALRQALRGVRDIERLTNRAVAGTANARDLRALGSSIAKLPEVRGALSESLDGAEDGPEGRPPPALLEHLHDNIEELDDVAGFIDRAVVEEPPSVLTEGDIIRDGFSEQLDELRGAMTEGRQWIAQLQERERNETGIETLKVGFNKVFGYYIEVTKAKSEGVPDRYQRKQTLTNAERYITPELKEVEAKVLGAEEKSQDLEYELFCEVRREVAAQAQRLLGTARALAQLDVLLSLAEVAVENDYARPQVNASQSINIEQGRHPVVERAQAPEPFVPNDATIDNESNQLLIVTGPNMAGKSTYLRQVALICLLAQIGSFIPGRRAEIGVVDRIFTRVGASDDLATGQSTFMVEMTEAANILNNATDRSLIILDEIGRGTSTFDGLSIAWAVAEFIVENVNAKTLFATHYHHLNELAEILPRVRNLRITVKEQGDDIVFLRKIVPGSTDRSYGIQVARLAGLPPEVIDRAKQVLHSLEQEDLGKAVAPSDEAVGKIAQTVQLRLFEAAEDPAIEQLRELELDSMTPIEALSTLKRLQEEVESREDRDQGQGSEG